jgi:hypothetical protein
MSKYTGPDESPDAILADAEREHLLARVDEAERLRQFADEQWVAADKECAALRSRVAELEGMLKESGEHDRAEMWRAKANGLASRVAELESALRHIEASAHKGSPEAWFAEVAATALASAAVPPVPGEQPTTDGLSEWLASAPEFGSGRVPPVPESEESE